jgi:RNA polymerase sigma-70 factor (sigma-E family)
VRADDEDAYVEYVAARRDWLRRLAYRLCGDWDRADDLAQQVCVRLYVYWHKAAAADTVDAYVRQMAVHAWLTEQRGGWFRRVLAVPAVPDRPVAGPDPGRRLDILDALAHLAPGHRAVLVLRFWEQLSVAETAALLRCAEGTVKSQTSHGLAALRKLLPGYAGHSLEES